MKIFVVGASGRTGKLVVKTALARGHEVTAFVRHAHILGWENEANVIAGDPTDSEALANALPGHHVVISTLGRRSNADGMLLRDSSAAMLKALPASTAVRYIVVSQGLLFPSRNPIIWLLRRMLASTVADSTAMEQLVRHSAVEWTIVRPPRLKQTGIERGYSACRDARPRGAFAMNRAALAAFLVDEAERRQFPRSIVGLG